MVTDSVDDDVHLVQEEGSVTDQEDSGEQGDGHGNTSGFHIPPGLGESSPLQGHYTCCETDEDHEGRKHEFRLEYNPPRYLYGSQFGYIRSEGSTISVVGFVSRIPALHPKHHPIKC